MNRADAVLPVSASAVAVLIYKSLHCCEAHSEHSFVTREQQVNLQKQSQRHKYTFFTLSKLNQDRKFIVHHTFDSTNSMAGTNNKLNCRQDVVTTLTVYSVKLALHGQVASLIPLWRCL